MSVQVLPEGEIHTYILPEAAWDVPTQRAALLDGVPFTHPSHVCAILELLRHQCAYNTLLNSCFTPLSTCPGGQRSSGGIISKMEEVMMKTYDLITNAVFCFF